MWVNRDGTTKKLIPRYSPRIPVSAAAAAAAAASRPSINFLYHRKPQRNCPQQLKPSMRAFTYTVYVLSESWSISMGASPKIQMSRKQPWAQNSQPSLPFANPKYSRFHGVTQKQTNKQKKSNNVFAAAGSKNVPLWDKRKWKYLLPSRQIREAAGLLQLRRQTAHPPRQPTTNCFVFAVIT